MIKQADKYLEGLMQIEVTNIVEYPLRQKMDVQNMSIRKLGKLANVHYTYISRLLKGTSRASVEVACRIKDALGDYGEDPTSVALYCNNKTVEQDIEDIRQRHIHLKGKNPVGFVHLFADIKKTFSAREETDTCSDCGEQIIEEDCARNVCNGCRLEL